MSVWERRKGEWVAKFTLDGTQHWVKGGPWEKKSHALEAERRLRDRLKARRSDETCASFADRWLEEWPRKAAGTNRSYAYAMKLFAAEFGQTPLGEVERLSARTWALSVPRGVSRVVGIMYEDARNIGLVESNPFSNLRLPVIEKTSQIIAPTMEEYRSLLAACTVTGGYATEFRALIQFAAWSGLRSGEIQALRWQDIEENYINVCHSRDRDGTLKPPKNGYPRRIAFLPPARVLDQVPRREGSEFVFHNPRGGPLRNGSLFYMWKEVRAAAGIRQSRADEGQRDIRFHDLRHFYAHRLKEKGLDPYTISLQMGHRDGGTLVIERYGMGGESAANERLLDVFDVGGRSAGNSATDHFQRIKGIQAS